MLPGVENEWGGVHQSMDLIIVGEPSYRQPFVPIVLALIYEDLQELLDFLIDPLCLTIGLRVVSGGRCCNTLKHSLQRRVVENHPVFERSLLPRWFLSS